MYLSNITYWIRHTYCNYFLFDINTFNFTYFIFSYIKVRPVAVRIPSMVADGI
jgi:hypothetical protein